MKPRFEMLNEKHFVGKSITMSLANNKTKALWMSFMPSLAEIENRIDKALYSVEIYPSDYFTQFNPTAEFEKWAVVAVANLSSVPNTLKTLHAPAGLYAVFIHKGLASAGPKTYEYIFGTWLPTSDYEIDTRPHFAVMGEGYKPDDPNSEEELWIPIKQR